KAAKTKKARRRRTLGTRSRIPEPKRRRPMRPEARLHLGTIAAPAAGLIASTILGGAMAPAHSQAIAFAGSVQERYLFSPTTPRAVERFFDGFTTEASLKLSADVGDHVSGQVKVCFGCHGFELGMAFVDLRVADELNFRIGRFSPTFGEFPLRHDPANHRTV